QSWSSVDGVNHRSANSLCAPTTNAVAGRFSSAARPRIHATSRAAGSRHTAAALPRNGSAVKASTWSSGTGTAVGYRRARARADSLAVRRVLRARRVLRPRALAPLARRGPGGPLRMLEHVRATGGLKARVQDRWQPLWTRLSGGCHWNRETERSVEAAGFRIEAGTRRAKGDMRRFVARPG